LWLAGGLIAGIVADNWMMCIQYPYVLTSRRLAREEYESALTQTCTPRRRGPNIRHFFILGFSSCFGQFLGFSSRILLDLEFGGSGFAKRWCGLLALVDDELRQTSRCLSGDAVFGIFGGYFSDFLGIVRGYRWWIVLLELLINKVVDHGDQTVFFFSTSLTRTSISIFILSSIQTLSYIYFAVH
jgi:hypothetical protein